jgi:chromosomal replication initiator protein
MEANKDVVHGVFSIPLGSPMPRHATSLPRVVFAGDHENAPLTVVASNFLTRRGRYHPTTLCGPTGVGKSMLLRGFVANYRQLFPSACIYLRTAADFARDYADALDTNSLAEFRDRTRRLDFFALDDVHQIQHKKSAQEELCRTLDELVESRIHTLLSVTSPLNQSRLLPGLLGRLDGGLVVPIQPPNKSTRSRLLQQSALTCRLKLAPELVDWLLADVLTAGSTFREIHHCVQQMQPIAQYGSVLTIDDVRPLLEPTLQRDVTIAKIQASVAQAFQFRKRELASASRQRGITQARSVAMYLSRKLTKLSYKEIGSQFGNRDHSTVMYACRKMTNQITMNRQLAATIERLIQVLSPTSHYTIVDNGIEN